MITQLKTPLIFLLLGVLIASPVSASELKPIMKEMRLHFKHAIDATSPEQFNQKVDLFLTELEKARKFEFSSEREKVSLEGLDKVHTKVTALPEATKINLASVKEEFKQVDLLRKEYHKKAKPGIYDLLLKTLKQMF